MGPVYDTALLTALGHTSDAELLRKLRAHEARQKSSDWVMIACVLAIVGVIAFSLYQASETSDAAMRVAQAGTGSDHSSRP